MRCIAGIEFYPKLLADPRFADTPIIGLTATPWTKGLGKHFERLIIGSTTRELIDDRAICRRSGHSPRHRRI